MVTANYLMIMCIVITNAGLCYAVFPDFKSPLKTYTTPFPLSASQKNSMTSSAAKNGHHIIPPDLRASAVQVHVSLQATTKANLLEQILLKIIKKVEKQLSERYLEIFKLIIQEKLLKISARVLEKIEFKAGAKVLSRLGIRAGEKAAVILGEKLMVQPAAAANVALFIYDTLSLTLDVKDVDGYMKMGTVEQYIQIKKSLDDAMRSAFKEQNASYPSIVGPLDKLSFEEYKAKILMKPEYNDPDLLQVIDKIKEDFKTGNLTEIDTDDATKMNMYYEMIDNDKVFKRAFESVCTAQNGKLVYKGNNDFQCSYENKTSCESSYSWPLADGDIYAEYKEDMFGGSCIVASYGLRGICESNKIAYDTHTGMCKIDENYCKMKGTDWVYNDHIKTNDCLINTFQNFAETVFGTSIVRGLKQAFDSKQYESCNSNEIDDGYFCRSISCVDGQEQWANGGICYPKCKQGFHPFGCCICSPDCSPGWTDDGAFCRQAGVCTSGKDHQGALCYDKCRPGFTGVGPVCWKNCPHGYKDIGALCSKGGQVVPKKSRPADKRPCPDGLRDDGTSCWRDSYGRGVGRMPDKAKCPEGMRDDGISCWKDSYGRGVGRLPDKASCPTGLRDDGTSCWRDAHIYGKGCCCTVWGCCRKCPKGYHDDGCTCRKTDIGIKVTLFQRQSCRANEEKYGALCYPKCAAGYHSVGCCICEPEGGPGIKVTLQKRQSCRSDEEMNGGLCYPKCRDRYHPVGCCICQPSNNFGINVVLGERQYCKDKETLVAGICWGKCENGFVNDGALCRKPLETIAKESYGRGAGSSDVHIIPKPNTSYGRGVGEPAVHIRAKKRNISFSSKDN